MPNAYQIVPNLTTNFYRETCPTPAKAVVSVSISWLSVYLTSLTETVAINIESLVQGGQISGIQSAIIDNSANDAAVLVIDAAGTAAQIPANSWGAVPVRYQSGSPIQIALAGSGSSLTNQNNGITVVTLQNTQETYKIWTVEQTSLGSIDLGLGNAVAARPSYGQNDGLITEYFYGTINPAGDFVTLTALSLNNATCPNGFLITNVAGGTVGGFTETGSLTDLWGELYLMNVNTYGLSPSSFLPQYLSAFEWKTGTSVAQIQPGPCGILVTNFAVNSTGGPYLCAGINVEGTTPSSGATLKATVRFMLQGFIV